MIMESKSHNNLGAVFLEEYHFLDLKSIDQ